MKNTKGRNSKVRWDDYDEDEEYLTRAKKKESPRRQVRNWKKAWVEHQTDYDEHDEFFGK